MSRATDPATPTITFDAACAKYGIEPKRLRGLCLRQELDDPLVVEKRGDEYILADDWRLQRLTEKA